MPVVRSSEARRFEMEGFAVTSLAAPSVGSSETALLRAEIEPGRGLPAHRHDHEEVFHVLRGRGTVLIGDEEVEIGEGDTVMVPAGELHRPRAGEEPLVLLATMRAGTAMITEDGERKVAPWVA
ncbi:MAG TPA: cupin domain-containing protein [Actinomycetota bacterium]|nr:cupin domain-containing protein [Actinomycetota bacterium]